LSILKPDSYLSSPYQDADFEMKMEGTNVMLRPKIGQAKSLRSGLTMDAMTWYRFVRADDEAARLRRQQAVEETVKRRLDFNWEATDTELQIRGRQTLGFVFGDAFYLDRKDRKYKPSSSATKDAPELDQTIEIHIVGRIGKKVTVNVDTSRKTLQRLQVDYDNRQKEDAFVQYITAGNIPVSIAGTALASGSSGGGGESFGIKADARKGKVDFQFIASMARGIPAEVTYKGSDLLREEYFDVRRYQAFKYFKIPQDYKAGQLRLYLDNRRGLVKDISIAGQDCEELVNGPDWLELGDGLIEIRRSLNKDYNVFAWYEPVSGVMSPATNAAYNAVYSNVQPTYTYRYIPLLAANAESPYEFRGVFKLAAGDLIDTSDSESFGISLVETTSREEYYKFSLDHRDRTGDLVEDQGDWTRFYLDQTRGIIAFRDREPFRKPFQTYIGKDPSKYMYTYTPEATDKSLSLYIKYKVSTREYQLHPDIIEGSEVVKEDGRILQRGVDYTIDYFAGTLEFLRLINPESEINIVYQYSPYGDFSQQFLVGLRTDYKPFDWLNFTGLGVYNGRQRPVRVPTVSSAAEEKFVGAVAGSADFSSATLTKAFSNVGVKLKKPVPVSFGASGEVAGSLYNPNNFGLAIVDDFEGKNILSPSMNEVSWLLYTPVDTEVPNEYPASNRGRIYFKDYYDYTELEKNNRIILPRDDPDLVGFGNPPLSDRESVPYTVKPGPYRVADGHIDEIHLDPTVKNPQNSLVFEYDFHDAAPGEGWVAVIKKDLLTRSISDFSAYLEANLWVKLLPLDGSSTNRVELRMGLGSFSEDIDNDGAALEEEDTANSGGIRFNDPWRGNTWVGGGSGIVNGGVKNTNDGTRQSEDIDNNHRLDRSSGKTNLFLPGGEYAVVIAGNATNAAQSRLVIQADSKWHLVRIAITKDAMTPEQLRLWQRGIRNIALILEQNRGYRGKLLVDTLNFTGPSYSDLRVNANVNNTNVFQTLNLRFVSTLDKGADSYFNNSLRKYTLTASFADHYEGEKNYDYLHGRVTEQEWNQTEESAMEVTYNGLTNHDFTRTAEVQTNTMVLVGRYFSSVMDFRFYKMLKMWVKMRQRAGDEWFFVRFGSSAQDYYEYRVRASQLESTPWYLVKIDTRSESFQNCTNRFYGPSDEYRVEGLPNLRAVAYVAYGVYGAGITVSSNLGRFWINDVYLDKVEYRGGYAYTWSAHAALDGHLAANYAYSFVNKDYSGQGAAGTGVDTEAKSFSLGWSSLPWMPVTGTWSRGWTESDRDDVTLPYSLKGRSEAEVYSLSGGLSMSSWEKLFKKYAVNAPDFQATYRVSVASNQNFRTRAATNYSIFSRSLSDSWNTAVTWKPPFVDRTAVKIGAITAGYAYTRSDARSWIYHGYTTNNSITNYISNPITTTHSFNIATRANWSYEGTNAPNAAKSRLAPVHRLLSRLSLGIGEWAIAPSYGHSEGYAEQKLYRFFDNDLRPITVTNASTHPSLISSRSRSFSTPVDMGKIFFLTPGLNYSVNYDESGFFRKPASDPKSNQMIRNPSIRVSMSEKFGEITFKNFFIRSISLNYSRSFGLSDAGIRCDNQGGWGYFGSAMGQFGGVFAPVPFQYIPFNIGRGIHKPWFPNMDFVTRWSNRKDVAVTLGESIGATLGIEVIKGQRASVSYSFSQDTARSRGYNYTFTQRHSLSHGSSFDLMKIFKGFLIWKESKNPKYRKSSSLGYSVSYSFNQNYITSMLGHSLTIGMPFSFGWTSENAINFSASYTYNLNNIFSPSNAFQDYVKANIAPLFSRLPWVSGGTHPRADGAFSISASYGFPSNLPETWMVPIIHKVVKLDTRINHSSSLSYANKFYYYQPEDPNREPDDLLAQFALRHSIRYDITANINGTIWLKFAYDIKGIKGKGNKVVERDDIGSYETGIQLAIVF
jgi:hypothetical protein